MHQNIPEPHKLPILIIHAPTIIGTRCLKCLIQIPHLHHFCLYHPCPPQFIHFRFLRRAQLTSCARNKCRITFLTFWLHLFGDLINLTNMPVLTILEITSKPNTFKKTRQTTEHLGEKWRERKCTLHHLVSKFLMEVTFSKH